MDHHSWSSARQILIGTARALLKENRSRTERSIKQESLNAVRGQLGYGCMTVLFLSLSSSFYNNGTSPALLWAAAAATFTLVTAAAAVVFRAHMEASRELYSRLASIFDDFEHDIEQVIDIASNPAETFEHGSPILSVYPVYRDGLWQRVPVLLLVKGDLIALSAGDPAPGASELAVPAEADAGAGRLERRAAAAESPQREKPGVNSDAALMSLCGDIQRYRLLETPLHFMLEEILETTAEFPRPPLAQIHLKKLVEVGTYCKGGVLAVVFLAGLFRVFVLGNSKLWAFYLLVQPSVAMLVLLFPTLPVLLFTVEALATVQLLAIAESLTGDGKISGDLRTSKAALRLFVSNTSRVLSQRLGFGWLEKWVSNRSLLQQPVPLRSLQFVERLGCVTELCVVDDEVVCEPFTVPKEIFFKEDSTSRGTILRLYESSATTHFESPTWWKNLPSLKPMGLASLTTSYRDSNQSKSSANLVEHLKRAPHRADALTRLSSEIGFTGTDLNGFSERIRVNVMMPATVADQSQQEMWQRGALHHHIQIDAVIVEDVRSNALQLLARGGPVAILDNCTDFWDGKNISTLGVEDRKTILEKSQQWILEDRSVVALCYSPIPLHQENFFRQRLMTDPHTMLLFGERPAESPPPLTPSSSTLGTEPRISLRDSIHTGRRDRAFENEGTDTVRNLLRQQIFLGMVALRVPLKENVQAEIQHCFDTGVRFIFFSPRNMRRSKALADALGLETDWNCAISLKEVEDSAAPTWSVNAQMPFGVEAIQQHLEEGVVNRYLDLCKLRPLSLSGDQDTADSSVNNTREDPSGVDNVPLLVSMFTDSTPDTVKEMIQVFEEYAETVMCIGTSFRSTNSAIFRASDVAISVNCLPGGQRLESLAPARTPDIRLNQRLVSLQCALVVPSSGDSHGLSHTMTLQREGRRVLSNIYQLVHFTLAVSGTLGAVVVLSTVAPVSSPPSISSYNVLFIEVAFSVFIALPMLASVANPSILKQPQPKNELSHKWTEEVRRFINYFVMRTLPTAIVCIFIYVWEFGDYLAKHHSSDVASCHSGSGGVKWYHTTWCGAVELGRKESHVKVAHEKAEALMVFSLVLALAVQSAGYLQRTASLVAFSPFSNRLWFTGAILTVVIQLFISLAQAGVLSSTESGNWTPWQLWLVVVFWPLVALMIGERAKAWDALGHNLDLKYLELQFNTKLGQFSPR